MKLLSRPLRCAALAFLAALAPVDSGFAQSNAGCTIQLVGGTGRQVLRCRPGITITTEAGASVTLLDRDRNGTVDAARLRSKAILVDAPRGGFEVLTPQAIAAVRGTRWAVDVACTRTSVFVVEGSVAVTRRDRTHGVTLGAGEGVDVDPGSEPLTVRRWGRARATALLARLGQ